MIPTLAALYTLKFIKLRVKTHRLAAALDTLTEAALELQLN